MQSKSTSLAEPAALLLQDGTYLEGYKVGIKGTTSGELCFNTGMTGYQEIYTDPSYYGQLIINTATHIGNYGTLARESESERPMFNGLICRDFSEVNSRKSADASLQQFFEKYRVVGISGIDTRYLVRHIRQKGAMNAVLSSEHTDRDTLQRILSGVPSMEGLELSSSVSTRAAYDVGEGNSLKVAVLDLGVKRSILHHLRDRGLHLRVFPSSTTFAEMKNWGARGYFISNGPGDPASMPYAVETVRQVVEAQQPLFGICLGHQILALSQGVPTYKMHHGHRGLNHPVHNLIRNRSEVTSQNHGFCVQLDDVQASGSCQLTHVNLNDKTVEGLALKNSPAFSVQYHPEASPGPHDSTYLFDDFKEMIIQTHSL
jgi:carbamoyl-phosphate synthase small subunit